MLENISVNADCNEFAMLPRLILFSAVFEMDDITFIRLRYQCS